MASTGTTDTPMHFARMRIVLNVGRPNSHGRFPFTGGSTGIHRLCKAHVKTVSGS
jgi:hypothetical protein